MNIENITRNAENQVAAALADKTDRFRKAKKNRRELLVQVLKLANDLEQIFCRRYSPEMLESQPIAPLPARSSEQRCPISDYPSKPARSEHIIIKDDMSKGEQRTVKNLGLLGAMVDIAAPGRELTKEEVARHNRQIQEMNDMKDNQERDIID